MEARPNSTQAPRRRLAATTVSVNRALGLGNYMDGSSTACVNRGGRSPPGWCSLKHSMKSRPPTAVAGVRLATKAALSLSSNTWNKPQSSTESNRWPSDPSSNGVPHQEAGFEASVPGLLLGDFDGNRSSIDARSLPSPAARPLSACSAVPQPRIEYTAAELVRHRPAPGTPVAGGQCPRATSRYRTTRNRGRAKGPGLFVLGSCDSVHHGMRPSSLK